MLSWAASGSLGPGRLTEVGPDPGAVALAVGLETLVGVAILLLSPRGALAWMAGEEPRGERVAPPLD